MSGRVPNKRGRRFGSTLTTAGCFFFAGLYEEWHPQAGQAETTFTILTCDPNAVTRPIHNRMPVIGRHKSAGRLDQSSRTEPAFAEAIADSSARRSAASAAGIESGKQPEERRPRIIDINCDRRDARPISDAEK
jgi:putative SOS response-associated peptidase YedK